jgi:hypothetical protein
VWRNSHITFVVLMDRKAPFTRLAKVGVVSMMKVSQPDEDLVRWMERCLSEKNVEKII